MLFNSFAFGLFLIVTLTVYSLLFRRHRIQNYFLLLASYIFYGAWDWRFTALLATVTFINFHAGRFFETHADGSRKKSMLIVVICTNLSILGLFKYFGFFAENLISVFAILGFSLDIITLNIILPVGISFYTFQALGYSVDVYTKRIRAVNDFAVFALFVSFFPQLVAGPIEKARNLLPQITARRKVNFRQINAGLFLLLIGYFKKVVVADNVARIANEIFVGYEAFHGLDILVGVLAFTIQIYGDFSGYSDIARGVAKLLGFDLMVNFNVPYFSKNPREFWQRWHISLSNWLRDYLYIPLV